MILASLRDLAVRERLVSEPAFESKGVAWIINLDRGGKFLNLTTTLSDPVAPEKGRKAKPQPQMMSIPRRAGRTVNIEADFLVDKSEYVLGVVPEGKAAPKKAGKAEECRRAFLKIMERAARETASPFLRAVVDFLQDEASRSICITELNQQKYASNDLFAFSCDSKLLHLDPLIRDWWAAQGGDASDDDEQRQCVVCGERRVPVDIHDSLRIPGGVTSGVPLVSFNAAAFEKYGLSSNANAPVCRPCMTAYVEGFRRCLNERYPRPGCPDQMMGQQSVRLSSDTTAVYWTDSPSEMAGKIRFVLDRPADLKAALKSPWAGERPEKLDGRFYCLILSGVQGRATLRSVHTETIEKVEQSLAAYFCAMELDGLDRDSPLPLYALLRALAPLEKLDRLPPKLPGDVFLGAVLGVAIPRIILNAAVGRCRAERKVTSPRAALLQLYFSLEKQRTHLEVPRMSLNPEFHETGYLFGRLFAVLERIQSLANPGVGATIVDRFYGSASTRPGTVFPQLLRLSQAHLAKVPSRRNPDWYRKITGEIMDGLPAEFTPTLDLQQQGQFALGYYHQRQFFYRKAETPQPEQDNSQEVKEGATA